MADVEKQYQAPIRRIREQGHERLGLMTSWSYQDDPKRLAFTLARYKFVAKMFQGYPRVLEVGCGDAFVSRVVRQSVSELVAVDFDASFVEDARANSSEQWPIELREHNIMNGPVEEEAFDGVFSLDVMEHIPQESEDIYLANMCRCLKPHGSLIIGMPSIESQPHASQISKDGHVNCKRQEDLGEVLGRRFHNVFLFGMNDEVLHTGYARMTHYLFALCCGKRN